MNNEDWWWIDYIEGELDPTTHPDIEFLLEKSKMDREEFESWRLLKSWVKEVDPVKKEKAEWDSSELGRLKIAIMDRLDETSLPPDSLSSQAF